MQYLTGCFKFSCNTRLTTKEKHMTDSIRESLASCLIRTGGLGLPPSSVHLHLFLRFSFLVFHISFLSSQYRCKVPPLEQQNTVLPSREHYLWNRGIHFKLQPHFPPSTNNLKSFEFNELVLVKAWIKRSTKLMLYVRQWVNGNRAKSASKLLLAWCH